MEMPKPTAAHQQLERLAGHWRGQEKMHVSQWDPKGGVADTRMNYQMGINGFALIGDYEQARDGVVTFRGHAVFTIDPKTGDTLLHWFDCMGQDVNVFRGRFDGDRLSMLQATPMGQLRMTYQAEGSNRLTSKMEMSPDGKSWNSLFEGVYSKG